MDGLFSASAKELLVAYKSSSATDTVKQIYRQRFEIDHDGKYQLIKKKQLDTYFERTRLCGSRKKSPRTPLLCRLYFTDYPLRSKYVF